MTLSEDSTGARIAAGEIGSTHVAPGSGRAAATDLDPLIGRDEDMALLLEDVERSRLVSLTGPGGSGKTRLALGALDALRQAGHEAWFIDLTAVEDGSFVATTIMATLRLEGSFAREPMDVVIDALADRELVLCLDNLEQIRGIAGPVTGLLDGIPALRILATSRISLGIRGEVEVAVQTLDLPATPTVLDVESSPAGSLFLARARSIGRLRSIDQAVASDIRELLVRLGGLPLAIELAAARTRAMSPGEIVKRLDRLGPDAIDPLDGNRQRSLRAILDWTVGLLAPAHVTVLEAVSICAGFDLDLAQSLVPKVDVVDAVESLVAVGLVVPAGTVDGTSRFTLLETIRSAILRRLSDRQLESLRDRHAGAFVELAANWYRDAPAGLAPGLLDRMDADADNIRRALDRLDGVDPRRALVLGLHLEPFWHSRGRLAEGMARFKRTAALAPEPSIELARAAAGNLTLSTGVYGPSYLKPLTADVITMARRVGDQPALIDALATRMWIAANEGDAAAAAEVEQDLAMLDVSDLDARGRINLLELRIDAAGAREGYDSDAAVALARELLAETSAAGWTTFHAVSACNLAQALLARGDFLEAARLAGEASETLRGLGQLARVGWARSYQSAALAELGRAGEAMQALQESAAIADSLLLGRNVVDTLRNAMPLAVSVGQPLAAARCWGAVTGMVERGDADVSPLDQALGRRWLASAAVRVPTVAIELALREGRAANPLELLRTVSSLSIGAASPVVVRLRHGGLTKREVEVLALVGDGKTDRDIAEALFISVKTASVHVSNIKAKLGLGSRLAVALHARELGLVGSDPENG